MSSMFMFAACEQKSMIRSRVSSSTLSEVLVMSSKKDPEAGVHQRPWSLATRLTVIYALSAFAAVSMVSIILYVGLVRNLEEEDDQFLEERAHELQSMVTRGSDSLRELKS